MIRYIVGWVVLVPLCLVLIVFALANRQLVVVNFNPLVPSESLTTPGVGVPLFLVLFTVLLMGVVLGGIATWFAQSQLATGGRTAEPRSRCAQARPLPPRHCGRFGQTLTP